MNQTFLRVFLFIISIFSAQLAAGQRYVENPRNIRQCVKALDKILPEGEKKQFRRMPEDSISICTFSEKGCDYIQGVTSNPKSKLNKYFKRRRIQKKENIKEILLIALHRKLNKKRLRTHKIVKKIRACETEKANPLPPALTADTLFGVYIPKDIEDCFKELDKMIGPKDKQAMKKLPLSSKMIAYNRGLGTWLRHNWGLWSGSRLQLYLKKRRLYEPTSQSAQILEYYYDWLHKRNNRWQKFHNN